jgi:hypothetical protein
MKAYLVIGAMAQVGFGEMIAVTPEQFRSRAHMLTREGEPDDKEVAILATPSSVQTFKHGEIIGLSDVPKSQAAALEEYAPEKKDKKGNAFVDAVAGFSDSREDAEIERQLQEEHAAAEQAAEEPYRKAYADSADLKKQYPNADAYIAALKAKAT